MSQALNSINSVESNTYSLNPSKRVDIKWIIINPDNTFDGIEYVSFRSALNELMNTAVGDKLKEDYIDSIEGPFDEEDFDAYCFDHAEQIANELNFRVMRILK